MELSPPAERFKFGSEETGNAVDGFLVVAGGFDFDQCAHRVNYPVLTLREVAQSILACAPLHRCCPCFLT